MSEKLLIILMLTIASNFILVTNGQGKIVCYFGSWAKYRSDMAYKIEDIPGDKCTHVIYAFSRIDPNYYDLTPAESYLDFNQIGIERFTNLKKKYESTKFLLSVGGWSEGGQKFSEMVSEPGRRKTFVQSVVKILWKFNFDGLDLDWEYPGERGGKQSDKGNFVKLVRELRSEFDRRNWLLTAAFPIVESRLEKGYEVRELSQLFDQIHIMSYALHGVWENHTDVHSPLYRRPHDRGNNEKLNVNDGTNLLLEMGAEKGKLIVGVPFYGRTFTLSSNNHSLNAEIKGPGDAGPYTQARGTLAYFEICPLVKSENWTREFDSTGKVPYAYKGEQWVGYEDEESVAVKMNYIRRNGLGGTVVWTIDMDDFKGLCGEKYPLLEVINNKLRGQPFD